MTTPSQAGREGAGALPRNIMEFENKKELMAALANAEMEFPDWENNRKGNNKYLDLFGMVRELRPILYNHGIKLYPKISRVEGEDLLTIYAIHIATGQSIESTLPIVPSDPKSRTNDQQEMGGAITYSLRYLLRSMFLIVVKDDKDDSDGAATYSHPSTGNGASDKQKDLLKTLLKQNKISPTDFYKQHAIMTPEDLTKSKCSDMIKQLQS